MNKKLTWLHISDVHFHPKTEWRDSAARDALLAYLEDIYRRDDSFRPDLIFCTGDIAFGETPAASLSDQYKQAETFFDALLTSCGRDGAPLPRERLFVVPGNHDVNRESINSDAQATLTAWSRQSRTYAPTINQRVRDFSIEFSEAVRRLDEYARFVSSYLPHQEDADGRLHYARVIEINGLKVGVAGFNSAWSCAGPEDDRTLWLAAEWQFNSARAQLKEADVSIGLIHHPNDWLNEAERDTAVHRIAGNFHFWLHGHSHNAWVVPTQSHVTIAAGAVGAQESEEFGVNLVRLDFTESRGVAYLHAYTPRDGDWTIAPVARHAPNGQWPFDLPSGLRKSPPHAAAVLAPPTPAKRDPGMFGREALIKDAAAKLQQHPFLLVYGLRGNGKSTLVEALGRIAPLAGKEPLPRFVVTPSTTATDLFRQIAVQLGETAEVPKPPSGDARTIAAEVQRRYPNPRPAWIWLDRAHHLLDSEGFLSPEVRNLLLGLQIALGTRWHWVLELRERPGHGLLGASASECEVPGLDKNSLAECLAYGAPEGRKAEWRYTGDQLKGIYQWLGGGHGKQAHPLAIQLLIEVARGRDEPPVEVLKRHRGDFELKIEEKLLGDLYANVLGTPERHMIQALALYRSAIPHDHAEDLEHYLNIQGAWDGLDRRCLLSSNADQSLYYLHSFIAGWLRKQLGYAGHGEDDEADFADTTSEQTRQQARELHSAIAASWLKQLRGSRRITNLNISRALEAFHHLMSAGETFRVQDIAAELLAGNLDWALERITKHYDKLFRSRAPIVQQRQALEYWIVLDPTDHKAQRFLGECWAKEEGWGSPKALACFEEACHLRRDFPPYWANLGRSLLAQGKDGAASFLQRLEKLEEDYPRAIDDHVRSIQSTCLELIGQAGQAAALRMEKIHAGIRDAVFYNDEAKARLDAGDPRGALEVLDLAERNGCATEVSAAMRATALDKSGRADQAAALRMKKIHAGSRHAVFYNDEARARLGAGDPRGALEIIDLAERNGCADDYTEAMRAEALQKSGRADEAAALRMEKIHAGIRDAVFYNDEAKARLGAGDPRGALEVLDLAERNGCADDYTEAMRANVLRHLRS